MRRAAFLTTLSLLIALAIGVGGFVASDAPGRALAAALPATHAIDAATATSLFAMPRAAGLAADASRSAIPVHDQPFEATRLGFAALTEAPVTAATLEDVVRASRVATAASATPALQSGDRTRASVSFYYCQVGGTLARGDGGGFCGAMRDGSVVYNGAAACDIVYLGQRFRIDGDPLGRIYRCADTGSAVHGLHRDIWFATSDDGWKWQQSVGQSATIEILS